MKIELLYFAAVRDRVGRDREALELPRHVCDVATLSAWLPTLHPTLDGVLDQVRFAVDESFAAPSTPLHDGAVVAIIPPVAGG